MLYVLVVLRVYKNGWAMFAKKSFNGPETIVMFFPENTLTSELALWDYSVLNAFFPAHASDKALSKDPICVIYLVIKLQYRKTTTKTTTTQ